MIKQEEITWDLLRDSVARGDMQCLEAIYVHYKSDFMAFVQKYALDEADLTDIYQSSILALYENVTQRKVQDIRATIKTYLFSIGKFKVFNLFKKQGKVERFDTSEYDRNNTYEMADLTLDRNNLHLTSAMNQLGSICRKLLIMSYYKGIKNKELLDHFDYKNDQSLRANKSKCLRKLRNEILRIQNNN